MPLSVLDHFTRAYRAHRNMSSEKYGENLTTDRGQEPITIGVRAIDGVG
jgi:hypothetical protein